VHQATSFAHRLTLLKVIFYDKDAAKGSHQSSQDFNGRKTSQKACSGAVDAAHFALCAHAERHFPNGERLYRKK
jgi:hypothetical protein